MALAVSTACDTSSWVISLSVREMLTTPRLLSVSICSPLIERNTLCIISSVCSSAASIADFIEYAECNEVDIHGLYFDLRPYEGTKTCLMCHAKEGTEMLNSGHFKWEGNTDRIVGLEGESHGKNDLLNNFCVAVPTNEPRCSQCHAGYGMKDNTFDFTDPLNVDCLVCHDQSGTYAKNPTNAGWPMPTVDLQAVASSIRQ